MTAEAWSAFADCVMAGAAVAAAIAAFSGLNSWRNQEAWRMDHDLARRLMVAYGRYKNGIYGVRHPFMHSSEMKLEDDEATSLSDREIRRSGIFKAYAARWEKVASERASLDAMLLEANAIWGDRLAGLQKPVEELVAELSSCINLYLREIQYEDDEMSREYARIRMSKRDILYDRLTDGDIFRQDFESAMAPIHEFLRTKIGGRSA